jgi:hypothetical protein
MVTHLETLKNWNKLNWISNTLKKRNKPNWISKSYRE